MSASPQAAAVVASSPQSGWRRWLALLVRTPTLLVLVLTIASFAARYNWRCEQVCHFRLQYGWLLLSAATVLVLAKDRRFAGVAACVAAVNFLCVLSIYWPANQPRGESQAWKVISYNVLSSNQRYDDVLAMLRSEQADVVLVCEVNGAWARELDSLSDVYPHRHIVASNNNFGIALLSRVPWRNVRSEMLGSSGVISIVAEFDELGSPPFTFIGTHPLPPGSPQAAAARNSQLRAIAEFIRKRNRAAIVAGDLNVTSYSPYFHDLLQSANLRDSRQGIGVQASWSPRIPLLFSIPIDHVLVSPEFEVVRRRVGEKLGSDHQPVIVELRQSPRSAKP